MDSKEVAEQPSPTAATPQTALAIRAVSHAFGANQVLQDVSLQVAAGEIVCLLGASGSGKSTLLRIVAGLEPLQQGEIQIPAQPLAIPGREPSPETRRCGFVFQDHGLFPHLNAMQNVEFGLHELAAATRTERAMAELKAVGLEARARSYPHTLSGGEQQRVALARALAPKPSVMLLDEPFASVDATLRRRLREDTRAALRASGVPSVLVTHDAEEALELADRIVVIQDGRVAQDATPDVIWRNPATQFVAEMLYGVDAISATATADGFQTAFGEIVRQNADIKLNTQYAVIPRPGSVVLRSDMASSVHVADIGSLGARVVLTLEAGEERLRLIVTDAPNVEIGDSISVEFDGVNVLAFPLFDNDSH